MKQKRTLSPHLLIAGLLLILFGCDQASRVLPQQKPTYSGCLQIAMGGSHNLSATDIRSLCAEAAQVIDARYEYKDNKVVPSNDFTRCYDKEKKVLETAGVSQAIRLAKLSCKYPDVQ